MRVVVGQDRNVGRFVANTNGEWVRDLVCFLKSEIVRKNLMNEITTNVRRIGGHLVMLEMCLGTSVMDIIAADKNSTKN